MTKQALDSAYPPSAAQIVAARAAGYVAWFGYFKFGNDGVLNGWSDADFKRVQAGGLQTIAYCSGWAPPAQCLARADALQIRVCLDDEAGMRADGFWVQGWLDTAQAGLYGNSWVHPNRRAAFHVLAAYPRTGDPVNASWWVLTPRPAGLCAWQWCGSHPFAGLTVDSTWLDDGFFSAGPRPGGNEVLDPNDPLVKQLLAAINDVNLGLFYGTGTPNAENAFSRLLDAKITAIVEARLAAHPSTVTVPTHITLAGELT